MKRLAALSLVLFVAQVALCGVRGFGLGELAGTEAPQAAASCHGPAATEGPDPAREEERRRCRAHCELFGQALAGTGPDLGAPLDLAILPAPPQASALPGPETAPVMARTSPPGVPRPILHRSLLL